MKWKASFSLLLRLHWESRQINIPTCFRSYKHCHSDTRMHYFTVICHTGTMYYFTTIPHMSGSTIQRPFTGMSRSTIQRPLTRMSRSTIQRPLTRMSRSTIQRPLTGANTGFEEKERLSWRQAIKFPITLHYDCYDITFRILQFTNG